MLLFDLHRAWLDAGVPGDVRSERDRCGRPLLERATEPRMLIGVRLAEDQTELFRTDSEGAET